MQPQASGAPAPKSPPRWVTRVPKPVGPAPRRRRRLLWLVLVVLGVLAGALLHQAGRLTGSAGGPPTTEIIPARTVTVVPGDLEQTIRLTGVTAAQNFASLTAPRIRGGRRGRGRSIGSISTQASRSSGGSSTSVSVASLSGSSSSSSQTGSTLGAPPSSSAAFRAATSRFAGATSSSASSSSGSSSTTATMGSTGLGSTGANLPGGSSGPPSIGSSGGGYRFILVLQHLAKPGSRVRAGDVVAEFDRHDALNRLDDYKAQVAQAEASMKSIRAQLEVIRKAHEQSIQVSKSELDKARLDLKTIPVRSAIDAEVLRLAAEEAEARHEQLLNEVELMETSLKAQLRIAALTLDEAKVELKRIEADTDRMLVRAPIDGIVVMQSIWRAGEQGQIQEGDQLHRGQPFMRIVDPDSMVVDATVNQVDSELMRIGAKARVYFDAYPDLELPATVDSIGAITKNVSRRTGFVKVIPVSLKLEAIDSRVIPDLSTSVDVILGTAKNALIAPLETILSGRPGSAPYVLLQNPSGWERREVELGLASNVAVVVQLGLEAGDVIARQRLSVGMK